MKVAFAGASSTGKTTLASRLRSMPGFLAVLPNLVGVDARDLLRSSGHQSMDAMSSHETRPFQRRYLEEKLRLESAKDDYLTERSFVDVAAFWIERDTPQSDTVSDRESFVERCRMAALRYDFHVYFPLGAVTFSADGYRSTDMGLHRRIDARIQSLLADWQLEVLVLHSPAIDDRRRAVLERVLSQ